MENKKYDILMICIYGTPSHIVRFINNLKNTNPNAKISLYSERDKNVFPHEMINSLEEYIQLKKFSGWPHRLWIFRKIFDHYTFVKQFKKLSETHHYDITNIHFPQYMLYSVMKYIRKMSSSVVVSPWGSDVLRINDQKKKNSLKHICLKSDYITVDATGIFGDILYKEMHIDKEKFHPLTWGSETIDYINEHVQEISTKKAKEILGFNDKYVITCGYNAFEEQRHEVIIKAINTKRKQLPNNLVLLFPVTYGYSYGTRKKQYVEFLKSLCSKLCLPAIFYEEYIPVSELFLLRRATDMFIHIQTTDGGNSSLQEYVLCGAKVVHGSWIHYKYLEQFNPLFYFPVPEVKELGNAIINAYNSPKIHTPNEVIEHIKNRGWKSKMILWNDFFISCLK